MFKLNDAINSWCQSVYPSGLERKARIDELADHLHCEVARFMGEGHSEEEAFRMATVKLGEQDAIAAESVKNYSGLGKFLHVLFAMFSCNQKALRHALSPKEAAVWLIGMSLFFANLMILTSWLTPNANGSQTWVYLLIAVWWVPFTMLSQVSEGGRKRKCAIGR